MNHPNIKQINLPILERVKCAILRDPAKLEMIVWKFGGQRCIGGFILDLTPIADKLGLGLPAEDVWGLELESAAKILNITIAEANKLFPLAGWPKLFYDRYYAAKNSDERAIVTTKRIDYFINNRE